MKTIALTMLAVALLAVPLAAQDFSIEEPSNSVAELEDAVLDLFAATQANTVSIESHEGRITLIEQETLKDKGQGPSLGSSYKPEIPATVETVIVSSPSPPQPAPAPMPEPVVSWGNMVSASPPTGNGSQGGSLRASTPSPIRSVTSPVRQVQYQPTVAYTMPPVAQTVRMVPTQASQPVRAYSVATAAPMVAAPVARRTVPVQMEAITETRTLGYQPVSCPGGVCPPPGPSTRAPRATNRAVAVRAARASTPLFRRAN